MTNDTFHSDYVVRRTRVHVHSPARGLYELHIGWGSGRVGSTAGTRVLAMAHRNLLSLSVHTVVRDAPLFFCVFFFFFLTVPARGAVTVNVFCISVTQHQSPTWNPILIFQFLYGYSSMRTHLFICQLRIVEHETHR